MRKVVVLGATGTIGMNTLEVLHKNAQLFEIFAVAALRNVQRMVEICIKYKPSIAVMVEENAALELEQSLKKRGLLQEISVKQGTTALAGIAAHPQAHIVMAAIVGAAGLIPTLSAVQAGKRVLLANKEALVMTGELFIEAIRRHKAELIPIDSEHNAIFQCLPAGADIDLKNLGVAQIHLTASGGPFLQTPVAALAQVTPEQAVAHPNWVMGKKISVDSATMMNKGLEFIEACWLFNAKPEQVSVVVHPQSIIHSIVEYIDGSFLAQMGNPDMRTPIAHALAWPNRIHSGVKKLNLVAMSALHFEELDEIRFPCFSLARQAMRRGGTSTAILNAANEVAVDAFLNRRIGFLQIGKLIEAALTEVTPIDRATLAQVIHHDQLTRDIVNSKIDGKKGFYYG